MGHKSRSKYLRYSAVAPRVSKDIWTGERPPGVAHAGMVEICHELRVALLLIYNPVFPTGNTGKDGQIHITLASLRTRSPSSSSSVFIPWV